MAWPSAAIQAGSLFYPFAFLPFFSFFSFPLFPLLFFNEELAVFDQRIYSMVPPTGLSILPSSPPFSPQALPFGLGLLLCNSKEDVITSSSTNEWHRQVGFHPPPLFSFFPFPFLPITAAIVEEGYPPPERRGRVFPSSFPPFFSPPLFFSSPFFSLSTISNIQTLFS